MKSVKYLFSLGAIVIIILVAMIIQYSSPSKTVDFRGTIHDVVTSADGETTIHAVSVAGGEFLFKINDASKLENCCGDEIEIRDLSQGALIDVNYRKFLFKDEKVQTVKTLTLYE